MIQRKVINSEDRPEVLKISSKIFRFHLGSRYTLCEKKKKKLAADGRFHTTH
jgi:hypothetical protein